MLAIVRDAIDDGPYPFAREARVACQDAAYHEAFEIHNHMAIPVREVLHRPVFVNRRVSFVSSVVDAVFGVIFAQGMHSLISPQQVPRTKHQVAEKALVEKLFRILDCFYVRYILFQLLHQIH